MFERKTEILKGVYKWCLIYLRKNCKKIFSGEKFVTTTYVIRGAASFVEICHSVRQDGNNFIFFGKILCSLSHC